MTHIATISKWLRDWLNSHRMELGLCFRVAVSAVLTLGVSQLLNLRLPLWAVLTAVILTQMSVGGSLKATTDYFVGTLGGAIYAGAVGALVPQTSEIAFAVALAITVVPVAFVAATSPRFSAAPFTAVMVFLAPTITHLGPIASAFERVIEVAVGGIIGLIVSFSVLPARAYDLATGAAGHVLALMAKALPQLFEGFTRRLDEAAILHIQDTIGEAVTRLDNIAGEGKQERMTYLAARPDQGPLLRTLLRLRHDFVMIGRAAAVPLPGTFQARLGPELARISETGAEYLRANGAALMANHRPAPHRTVEAAFQGYAAEMAALRRQGLTRDLPVDAVERLFALGFALEQLHQNFDDLDRCIAEFSEFAHRNRPLVR